MASRHPPSDGAGSENKFQVSLHKMVTTKDSGSDIVVWERGSIRITDPHALQLKVLPKYFRTARYESFLRQLHMYNFRKVEGKGRWKPAVYAHDLLKGKTDPKWLLELRPRSRVAKGAAAASGKKKHKAMVRRLARIEKTTTLKTRQDSKLDGTAHNSGSGQGLEWGNEGKDEQQLYQRRSKRQRRHQHQHQDEDEEEEEEEDDEEEDDEEEDDEEDEEDDDEQKPHVHPVSPSLSRESDEEEDAAAILANLQFCNVSALQSVERTHAMPVAPLMRHHF